MRVPWTLSHCVSIKETRSRVNKTDIIILKPEMEGLVTPKEVFEAIDDMAFEIPILVLTNQESEHGLNTYIMEQGAADTVIRGQFARLVDAIEFALIRQKITTNTRKAADKNLADSKDKDAVEQKKQKQIMRLFGGDYAVDQNDE
tara:strand:- start:477 stop:911 length:435 start_codon:yes stop_codon:yes gene_type:complete